MTVEPSSQSTVDSLSFPAQLQSSPVNPPGAAAPSPALQSQGWHAFAAYTRNTTPILPELSMGCL
eukprot:scaffold218854_cov17-Tisochrysis_lutea.AAC.1